jgi:hypothetical protein
MNTHTLNEIFIIMTIGNYNNGGDLDEYYESVVG